MEKVFISVQGWRYLDQSMFRHPKNKVYPLWIWVHDKFLCSPNYSKSVSTTKTRIFARRSISTGALFLPVFPIPLLLFCQCDTSSRLSILTHWVRSPSPSLSSPSASPMGPTVVLHYGTSAGSITPAAPPTWMYVLLFFIWTDIGVIH